MKKIKKHLSLFFIFFFFSCTTQNSLLKINNLKNNNSKNIENNEPIKNKILTDNSKIIKKVELDKIYPQKKNK